MKLTVQRTFTHYPCIAPNAYIYIYIRYPFKLKLCPPFRRERPSQRKDNFGKKQQKKEKRWSREFSAFEPNRFFFVPKFIYIFPALWCNFVRLNISLVVCHIVSISTCQMLGRRWRAANVGNRILVIS